MNLELLFCRSPIYALTFISTTNRYLLIIICDAYMCWWYQLVCIKPALYHSYWCQCHWNSPLLLSSTSVTALSPGANTTKSSHSNPSYNLLQAGPSLNSLASCSIHTPNLLRARLCSRNNVQSSWPDTQCPPWSDTSFRASTLCHSHASPHCPVSLPVFQE